MPLDHYIPPISLQQYVKLLQAHNEMVVVEAEVDPYLEIAEITRRVVGDCGPALYFKNVKNSQFPVVTNLYGSKKRLKIAFGSDIEQRVEFYTKLITEEFPPSLTTLWKKKRELFSLFSLRISQKRQRFLKAPSMEKSIEKEGLNALPLLTSWKEDGGPFITLPLVYTESPTGRHSKNLGMYRIQRYNSTTTGLHWQIGKGGGFHFHEAEMVGQNLPVAIFIGGAPALTLSAIAPLPENVPELLFTSLILQKPLKMTKSSVHQYSIPWEADFSILGYAEANTRALEGPFGDHFGYLSLQHEFPIFRCQKIYHRKDAIYPATVVGPPPQEDLYLGEFLQNLFRPMFPIVMPSIKNIHTYSESGFHALAAVQIKERYEKEALSASMRVLGEGQLALTKIVFTIDSQEIDLHNFPAVFTYLLERVRGEEDIIIFSRTANDTLDYTGPSLNRGSKAIFIGTGTKPRRTLPTTISTLPSKIKSAAIYCPGCLVIRVEEQTSLENLIQSPELSDWPCIICVDNPKSAVSSQSAFLWQVFTRFEPGADIFFKKQSIHRNSLDYTLPMLIDARMKRSYPPILEVDPDTKLLVDRRWNEYFPK